MPSPPGKQAEYSRRWRERHPDEARTHTRTAMRRERQRDPAIQRERMRKWREENPEAVAASGKRYRERLRDEAIAAYGGACSCCGETHAVFLAFDHVDDDGAAHRLQVRPGAPFYRWLRDNGYPDSIQLLCHNCNWAKWRGGCPHGR